jgi:vancomycin resistance protein YoaR
MVKKLRIIILMLCFMMALSITAIAEPDEETTTQSEEKEDTGLKINKGVYIEDMDVGGLTQEEAQALVNDYLNKIYSKEIQITADSNQTVTTAGELGFYWSNTDIMTEAVSLGKTGNVIKRFKDQKDLEKKSKVYKLNYEVNADTLNAKLNTYASQYNVPHVNPTIVREGGAFKVVGSEAWGRIIDVTASADTIKNFLLNDWDKENAAIELAVVDDPPSATAADCEKTKDLLGSYTTSFSNSSGNYNRNMNIKNAARLINGSVVYPGETFSANDKVNPCTEANGYYLAGSYENGRVVDSLGGGICQVSTTLYNAVLRAELEVVQRSNHSMAVGYVPLAADAALAGTWKDLKFKNNTSIPLYVESVYTDGKITFNIYGQETRAAGRTVSFTSETISTTPFTQVITEDPSKPAGYKSTTSAGHTGYVAKLWKHVYLNGVEQSVELVNKSSYQASPAYVTVGTGQAQASAQPQQPATQAPETSAETTTPSNTTDTTQQQ